MSYAPLGSELIVTSGPLAHAQPNSFSHSVPKSTRRSTPDIPKTTSAPRNSNYPIIVHCHLCWDWVWQRPQQFLSRLSARHKILFVETVGPDPELSSSTARFW